MAAWLCGFKTKGDKAGFRANQPHLSVSLVDGTGLNWCNELAKFNAEGELAAKSMTTPERFNPIDHDGQPQKFVVIMGGLYDGQAPTLGPSALTLPSQVTPLTP